jgi:hypothetical protein
MTVKELIEVLQKYPQDLPVAFKCYSEQCILQEKDIKVESHCINRVDGWVQNKRPDMLSIDYLVFPGN